MILSLFNLITALVPLMLSLLLVHLYIPLWMLTTALSAMPHFVSGINFLRNFVNLLMMSPCHCHLILHASVHHHHYHFRYVSLLLSSTPDSKLTFSINPPQRSFHYLFGLISRILSLFLDLISSSVFSFAFSLLAFLFDCGIDQADVIGFSIVW